MKAVRLLRGTTSAAGVSMTAGSSSTTRRSWRQPGSESATCRPTFWFTSPSEGVDSQCCLYVLSSASHQRLIKEHPEGTRNFNGPVNRLEQHNVADSPRRLQLDVFVPVLVLTLAHEPFLPEDSAIRLCVRRIEAADDAVAGELFREEGDESIAQFLVGRPEANPVAMATPSVLS